jgi:hypothetical protein
MTILAIITSRLAEWTFSRQTANTDSYVFIMLTCVIYGEQELQPHDKEPSMYIIEEKGTGEKLYKVYEDAASCASCGPNRSFRLRLMDSHDRELIHVERPYISCDYCCGITSFFDIVNIWVRNYKSKQLEWRRFGQIRQFWCPLVPYFSVRNAVGMSHFYTHYTNIIRLFVEILKELITRKV